MGRKIMRWLFAILGGIIGYGVVYAVTSLFSLEFEKPIYEIAIFLATIFVFILLFYLLSLGFVKRIKDLVDAVDGYFRKLSALDLVLGTIGLLIGLGISYIVVNIISNIRIPLLAGVLSVISYITIVSICIAIAVRRKDDLRGIFKNYKLKNIKVEEEESGAFANKKFLDTSAIIDGRIHDVLKTGFIDGELIVPSFVLEELQLIADSEDSMKRERGRRGLDILDNMTHDFPNQVKVVDYEKTKKTGVDLLLLELTAKEGGVVMTNDYNLNKVAKVRDIRVLNINDLSNALRPVVLPGETFEISIVKAGKEQEQGVGFLNDGTMVVIEDGKKLIDTTQNVEVTSVLQTSAGRMIFAKVK